MAILFLDDTYRREKIFELLRANMPGVDLRLYPDIGNANDIDYAIVWRPEPGSLQNLPHLKAIFAISAGVDALVNDTTLPDVPLVRNIDPHLTTGVTHYVMYHVLRYHRNFHLFEKQQRAHTWKQYAQIKPEDRVVGIMGLGEMGKHCAHHLKQLNFDLRGWSRTPKDLEGVQSFHGVEQLHAFLSGVHILVNLLPLTDATRGILNASLFSALPRGAYLINAGRGAHMVEADILKALDTGQLAGASLDVFETEPLPPENPLWSHEKVTLTPHIASLTDYPSATSNILKYIDIFEKTGAFPHHVDRQKQY